MFIIRKRFLYLYLFIGICLKAGEPANSSKAAVEISLFKQTAQLNASSDFLPKMSNNPKVNMLLVGGISVSCIIIWWKLHINRLLEEGLNRWHADLSLYELQKISQPQLYNELSEFINLRYADYSDSEKRQLFLKETSNEIISLGNFVRWGSCLYSLKVGILFFISEKNIQIAKMGIRKLQYMRRVFVTLFQKNAKEL